jgi:hypothetical protein
VATRFGQVLGQGVHFLFQLNFQIFKKSSSHAGASELLLRQSEPEAANGLRLHSSLDILSNVTISLFVLERQQMG